MGNLKQKVFAMMSGGVDSSSAAALLTKKGFDVTGVFMKNWDGGERCPWVKDEEDARRVAQKLGIPFYVLNFEKEYRKYVFEPFLDEIRKGVTPNPDVFCNEFIKFGVFLEKALELGADLVATGHYARVKRKAHLRAKRVCCEGRVAKRKTVYTLLKARDEHKDQTYFLYRLNQFQLSKTLFPIGDYLKSEVRAMAKEFGLPTYDKPDSQGICFVGESPFETFLEGYIPQKKGIILDRQGRELGWHKGIAFYTIGQRKGIGVGGLVEPYYVAMKDAKRNVLMAVPERDELLYTKEVLVSRFHWISNKEPKLPLHCKARIRHGQALQEAVIESRIKSQESGESDSLIRIFESARNESAYSKFLIRFQNPQRALTPGQSLVLYQGKEVLGGGVIV